MHFCYILSPHKAASSYPGTVRIPGREWVLDIIQSSQTGPWYPHFAEKKGETSYNLFAGRLAGIRADNDIAADLGLNRNDSGFRGSPAEEPAGSWLALTFDGRQDHLRIASDLCLLQRWFYTKQGESWYFSNSLIYLKKVLGSKLDIEPRGIPYILLFGNLPWQYTPLKDVFSLLSGQVLQVVAGQMQTTQRADLPIGRADTANEFAALPSSDQAPFSDKIAAELRKAVQNELTDLDNVTIPLSGGLDSRFLTGCALEVMCPEQITTLTFGLPHSVDYRLGTKLARKLGLKNITLPADDRSYPELLRESFLAAEGIYWSNPTYPVRPMREIFQPGSMVLSGYLGEAVFGCYDLNEEYLNNPDYSDEQLFQIVLKKSVRCSFPEVLPLLASEDWDLLRYRESLSEIESESFEEKYNRWLWPNYLLNSANFQLMLHRDRAFFLTPYVHPRVMTEAYRQPRCLRCGQKGFYDMLSKTFPDLYRFPTKRNWGYRINSSAGGRVYLMRARRRLLSGLDKALWKKTGRFFYEDPLLNYVDPREMSDKRHRADILGLLEELNGFTMFNAKTLSALRDRYYRRGTVNPYLLWGLLTIGQWIAHYRSLGNRV
ncbi:hypothetical protein EHM69_05755 [candidate division KSB1 bacterium]|nr:MAG: hypothetical protein EHM69_05755 [candidate division KSB1 bacterium]